MRRINKLTVQSLNKRLIRMLDDFERSAYTLKCNSLEVKLFTLI